MAGLTFGQWLKRQRLSQGLTQDQLAQQIGCASVTLRKIEAEERRPSLQMAEQLAGLFQIPVSERPAFFRYARGDWASQPSVADGPALPWQGPSQPRSNLPAPISPLIGRQDDVNRLLEYLRDPAIRLVTLTGPPGIGKTSLGLETARAALPFFADGAFFVALATLEDPAFIPAAIAQALGFDENRTAGLGAALERGLREKSLLLVLDNCEHLVEIIAPLCTSLLAACPNLKILATSRESLRIPGEWVFAVHVLETPAGHQQLEFSQVRNFPALLLFAERARAVRSDFALTSENLQEVSAICARLDGLPLAIELFAARMRLMTPAMLLERMSDAFILSADGMRAPTARQKTLGAAIDWSYRFLSQQEQIIFACLSVFQGGFTLDAAEQILPAAEDGKTTAELITSLLDKSLLQRSAVDPGEMRFSMLVTIQQYGLARLKESGREGPTRDRHLAFFLDLAEKSDQAMRGPRQVEWIDRLEAEHENIRAALDWGLTSRQIAACVRLLSFMGWPWEVRGHYSEAYAFLSRLRMQPGFDDDPFALGRLLNHIGRFLWTQMKTREAQDVLEESLALSARIGPRGESNQAYAMNWLSLAHLTQNELELSRDRLQTALRLFQQHDDRHGIALTTFHMGILARVLGHFDQAHLLLSTSLDMFRAAGDLFFIARVSINIGNLFMDQGEYDRSLPFFKSHLQIDQQLRFWNGIADGWSDLCWFHLHKKNYDLAAECIHNSLQVCSEHLPERYDVYFIAGIVDLHTRQYALAYRHYSILADLTQPSTRPRDMGPILIGLAATAAASGQIQLAAQLYGAASEVIKRQPGSVFLPDARRLEPFLDQARHALGESAFQDLASQGSRLSPEESITLAHRELSPPRA